MTTMNLNATVGELVTERPSRARVFEKHGIDYCCGGKMPLTEACGHRGVSVDLVARELAEADAAPSGEERDWAAAALTELADHIEQTHHAYLRRELPRLTQLVSKVASVHGERHPEMREALRVFMGLRSELESHMLKEEQVLFPMIRGLEQADGPMTFHCGSINNPIRMMEFEHDNAGDALARLRELTSDYTPPADGCNTFRATLSGLAELEQDLHQHIHKENNILFPRAARLEAELAGKE